MSSILITITGYVFGILPYIREICSRVEKMQEILKEINEDFNLGVKSDVEFENSLNIIKSQLKFLQGESQKADEFFEQYKEIIIRNVKLIYDMAKNKNEKEIEGLARSLLNIVEASIYSKHIFVPLWYEIICFQTVLSGCVYSIKNNFEIVVNVQEEGLKQSLVVHGILTSLAKLFIYCGGRQFPIKNILQLSVINLSGHLSLRLYYNNTVQDLNKIEELLNRLKQRFYLYYPEGTYAVNYSSGENHLVIEISVPIVESSIR
ncbi:hypothetical protein [Caldicellulosiruptor naganoensis]|uniref:hypothetical protein n=1 Tax=Caldicellulosiruptor naganoensis TaxID=29324 RepID=UPI001F36E647|nr:hypothetical protein [Caldicellulosiruptor naganoensis]